MPRMVPRLLHIVAIGGTASLRTWGGTGRPPASAVADGGQAAPAGSETPLSGAPADESRAPPRIEGTAPGGGDPSRAEQYGFP